MRQLPKRFSEKLAGDDFELWKSVAQAVYKLRERAGDTPLTSVQRIAWYTWAASGVIGCNGFFDHSAEDMTRWAVAFDELKIAKAATAIRKALPLMQQLEKGEDPKIESRLGKLEQQFYSASEKTQDRIVALIRRHPHEAFAGLK